MKLFEHVPSLPIESWTTIRSLSQEPTLHRKSRCVSEVLGQVTRFVRFQLSDYAIYVHLSTPSSSYEWPDFFISDMGANHDHFLIFFSGVTLNGSQLKQIKHVNYDKNNSHPMHGKMWILVGMVRAPYIEFLRTLHWHFGISYHFVPYGLSAITGRHGHVRAESWPDEDGHFGMSENRIQQNPMVYRMVYRLITANIPSFSWEVWL